MRAPAPISKQCATGDGSGGSTLALETTAHFFGGLNTWMALDGESIHWEPLNAAMMILACYWWAGQIKVVPLKRSTSAMRLQTTLPVT